MVRRDAIHEEVVSRKAPKPIGPYVQALRVPKPGEMLFVSGQIPIEMPSGQVFLGDIKKQAQIAMANLRSIVTDAKFSMDEVAKVTIFLTDLEDFEAVNEVYAGYFVGKHRPARAVVEVSALPKGVGVEIEALAIKARSDEEIFDDEDYDY